MCCSPRGCKELDTTEQQTVVGALMRFMEVKNVCIAGYRTMQRATLEGG